jgi:hypothetical protein
VPDHIPDVEQSPGPGDRPDGAVHHPDGPRQAAAAGVSAAPTAPTVPAVPTLDELTAMDLPQVGEVLRAAVPAMRAQQALVGRTLLVIERKCGRDGFLGLGVTSFGTLCEAAGLATAEGVQLRESVRACERNPELERKVVSGEVSIQKAVAVGEVERRPELQKPGERPIDIVTKGSSKDVLDEVRKRKAEARTGQQTAPRTFFLTSQGLLDLDRTQQLEGRRRGLGVPVSPDEAVGTALHEYVDRHCPERKLARKQARAARRAAAKWGAEGRATSGAASGAAGGTARGTAGSDHQAPAAPPTAPAPGAGVVRGPTWAGTPSLPPLPEVEPGALERGRYIPMSEQLEVIARCGDRCWVAGCDNRADLNFAHNTPWRFGGDNRAWNVSRLCRWHHKQFDRGLWKVVQGKDGPVLVDVCGTVVGRLRAPT